MRRISIGAFALGVVLVLLPFAPALPDEGALTYHRHRYVHHWSALPREHHVIEQVRDGISTDFILNGTWFSGIDACALGWTAGDRIKLLAGDWHGNCQTALFYNASRHRTCELACR